MMKNSVYSVCTRERKINGEAEFLTWGNDCDVLPCTDLENKEGVGLHGGEGGHRLGSMCIGTTVRHHTEEDQLNL